MNYEETLRLIEAGFTADEIRQMANPETPAEPGADKKTPPEEGADKKTSPEEGNQVSADVNKLTEEVTKLHETVKMLQEANIKNARTGSPASANDPVMEQINGFLKEL